MSPVVAPSRRAKFSNSRRTVSGSSTVTCMLPFLQLRRAHAGNGDQHQPASCKAHSPFALARSSILRRAAGLLGNPPDVNTRTVVAVMANMDRVGAGALAEGILGLLRTE